MDRLSTSPVAQHTVPKHLHADANAGSRGASTCSTLKLETSQELLKEMEILSAIMLGDVRNKPLMIQLCALVTPALK